MLLFMRTIPRTPKRPFTSKVDPGGRGLKPGVDLDNSATLIDLMEGEAGRSACPPPERSRRSRAPNCGVPRPEPLGH